MLANKKKIQKERWEFAISELTDLGIDIYYESISEIRFEHQGQIVIFFPYSGWHTGKSILDGRGLNKLLTQLK